MKQGTTGLLVVPFFHIRLFALLATKFETAFAGKTAMSAAV